ncbi:unnamed protein product, partial [marine sediment metagenome]
YKLFLGFDILIKKQDKKLKRDLYLLLILIIPLILVSIMISHNENRYLLNVFPAVFIISSFFILMIFNMIKKKNKFFAVIFLILLLVFAANFQLKSTDNLIKNKINSYAEVKMTGLWINQNSEKSDLVATNSNPQIKYYADREIVQIPATEEEFEEILKSNENLKFFVISLIKGSPDWAYEYPNKKQLEPVDIYFADPQQKTPVLITYKL